MESEKELERSEETFERTTRSEYCLTEACTNPVALQDGQYCVLHSAKLKKQLAALDTLKKYGCMPEEKLPKAVKTQPIQRSNEMSVTDVTSDTGHEQPTSSMVAERGIKTAYDFAAFMGALMSDLVDGRVEPKVANAACQAGDKMLKVIEMQMRHGREGSNGNKTLMLSHSAKDESK